MLSNVEVIEPKQYLEFLNLLISQIEKAPHELQKQLIRSIVHKIIVHPDQIEVLMHVGKYVLDSPVKPGNDHSCRGGDKKKNLKKSSHTLTNGGGEGARTPDPQLAKLMLSQLSYTPISQAHFQRKWARSIINPLPYLKTILLNLLFPTFKIFFPTASTSAFSSVIFSPSHTTPPC